MAEGEIGDVGGEQQTAWHENYDMEDSTRKVVSRFKSEPELAKGYAELLNTHTNRAVVFPKDDATDEDKAKAMSKIYSRLGVPEKPEDYGFKKPDDLPDGIGWDEEAVAEWAKVCKEKNIPKEQAHAALAFQTELIKKQHAAQIAENERLDSELDQERKDAEARLRTEMGEEAYESYVKQCALAVKHYDGKLGGVEAMLNETGAGNHPVMIKLFNEIYKDKLEEGKLVKGENLGDSDNKEDPEAIQKAYFPNSPEMLRMGPRR